MPCFLHREQLLLTLLNYITMMMMIGVLIIGLQFSMDHHQSRLALLFTLCASKMSEAIFHGIKCQGRRQQEDMQL